VISGDPLTGRDSELAAIRRALSGVGNYSGAVIAGAAGVGKTRLAREVLARAEASGERTYWIVGTGDQSRGCDKSSVLAVGWVSVMASCVASMDRLKSDMSDRLHTVWVAMMRGTYG
jgi:hypothetical protein